jgi:hypothetical protein
MACKAIEAALVYFPALGFGAWVVVQTQPRKPWLT